MSGSSIDRLFELLPVVHRQRDEEAQHALRDLLRVIAEQVNVVEEDIAQLYENWFIETCQEWVVPYIGDLVGYQVPHSGESSASGGSIAALAPRAAVANYIRDLRRRGTLALLEELAADVGGFPAHAVEFQTLLGRVQQINHLDRRGCLAAVRDASALDLLDGPFDAVAHTVDLRRIQAPRMPGGRHNIPNAGVWLWRLRSYPVTHAPAQYIQRESGYFFFAFSATGNFAPIFARAEREAESTTIAAEIHVPAPIRRRALEERVEDYYGVEKSFAIWIDDPVTPVPAERIISADLTNWEYRPPEGKVVVDPKLGLIAVSREPKDMWVSYHYGFSGDVGAHESARVLTQPRGAVVYRVGTGETMTTLGEALDRWREEKPPHAVIEISDSGFYTEPVDVELAEHQTLQMRAANRCRPVLHLLDYHPSRGEALSVLLHEHSRFTLDGLLVIGRPLRVEGAGEKAVDARVVVRRATLVPGWGLRHHCEPHAPDESSLDIRNLRGRVVVERSIIGTIAVMDETIESDPLRIDISDSIVDATSDDREAVVGPGASYAWAMLRVVRSTVFGRIETHAIELAENSIFTGTVRVARRQLGCMRFCSLPLRPKHPTRHGADAGRPSRTPRRYHCQPDLVIEAAVARAKEDNVPSAPRVADELRRVEPAFGSKRFGAPDYAQLAFDCANEITRGADDESEMGAFHDLFLPQRMANLRARLDASTPAGMETGILFAD